MRSDVLQLVFCAIALVLGGACEEFLPKFFGVGFPVLLALTVSVAARKPVLTLILFALVAGAFEDALSTLPLMTSPCFFLVAALLTWRLRHAKTVLVLSYPLYEIWLKLIVPNLVGSFTSRVLMAIPFAALTAFAIVPLLAWLERKAALDAE